MQRHKFLGEAAEAPEITVRRPESPESSAKRRIKERGCNPRIFLSVKVLLTSLTIALEED